jgi:apolipoprotein N-acyltransferase
VKPGVVSSLTRRSYVFATVAGVIGGSGWLPFGLAPLIPVSFLLEMLALRDVSCMRDAVRIGLTFGTVRYLVASHFLLALVSYSWLAVLFYLMAVGYILPFALLESCGAFWSERKAGLPRSLGFGMLYTFGEWLRTQGDMSFPADLLSHAFGYSPSFTRFSAWTGSAGVSLWIGVVAWLLSMAVERRRQSRPVWPWLIAGVAFWIGPAFSPAERPQSPATMRIGIVQPSVTIDQKLTALRTPDAQYWEQMRTLTREAARGADLVLWPETARPNRLFLEEGAAAVHDPEMEAIAREVGVPILYGAEIVQRRGKDVLGLYNGAALANPDGTPGQWYGKQRLLPFVEGMPFGDWFGYDPAARARRNSGKPSYLTLLGNFSRGPEPTIFRVKDAKIGVLVCYEGMYPQLAREYALRGANMLAVLTNDIWWGRSVFAPWHSQMVTGRANELNLPVVRAANSGVSSYTDGNGVQHEQSRLVWTGTLSVNAQLDPNRSPTFYARIGDWPVWLIGLVFAACVVRGLVSPRR